MSVNKVIILGRLGQDPELKYTQSGMAVCKFSLATSKKKKDGTEVTAWHRCTAFDKRGEVIAQYLSKGRMLYIEGELSYGQYEKDGQKHYTTDIIVNTFSFVDSKGDRATERKQPQDSGNEYQGPGQNQEVAEDDMPF